MAIDVDIHDDLHKLISNADEYVEAVRKPLYVRRMMLSMLWSLIPLLFIYQELSLGRYSDDPEPMKIPLFDMFIFGITDETLFLVFLWINVYYGTRFAFDVLKVFFFARPLSLFYRIIFKDEGMAFVPHDVVGMKSKRGRVPIPRHQFQDASTLEDAHEVGEFVLRRPIFGFLEHFCMKMFFPFALWIWALICILCKLWPFWPFA